MPQRLPDTTGRIFHARLRVQLEGETVRSYVIRPEQVFSLGRTQGTSIVVPDPRVSRQHAELELRREGLFITDLGSRNGTFVGPERLRKGHPLRLSDGAEVQLGRHTLRVEIHDPDEEDKTLCTTHRLLDQPLLPEKEFELLEEIGSGGVGRVWVARQKMLGRKVAIKFMRTERKLDEEFQQRFLQEMRLCCKIHSPFVVKCYDVRLAKDRAYMIMELVHGPTALDLVDEGPLPIPESLQIGIDVAHALAAAAKLGIVHRDVKPANVLLHPHGMAKLTDFGIAKDTFSSAQLTQTGMGLGSLPYASPEQVMDAKTVDERSDIYGLGATLYHLIGGQPPFVPLPGEHIADTVMRIQSEKPEPLRSLRPSCPGAVAYVVERMLSKDPRDRLASAADTVQRLTSLRNRFFPRRPDERPDDTDECAL